jgi:hypothetical protein
MTFIDELERNRAETVHLYDTPLEDLDKTYGPGKWSVRFLLHHLADAESVLFYRIRRVISEPNQTIWVYDQDAWAKSLDYDTVPLDLSRRIFESSRDGVIHYARAHYAGSENIPFVHSATGPRTLKDEFDKVLAHNAAHLDQIRRALKTS